jgi:simple sugar transport system ATP-binding protein
MVVSSELDEVIGLADRIAVMYRGRIIGIVGPDTPREEIGLLMAGISPDAAHESNTDAVPGDGPATDGSPARDAGSANKDEA